MKKLIVYTLSISAILLLGITCKSIKYRNIRYRNCKELTNTDWKLTTPLSQHVNDTILFNFRENHIDIIIDNDTATGLYFFESCEGSLNVFIEHTKLDLHLRNVPNKYRRINKLVKLRNYYKLKGYENLRNSNDAFREVIRFLNNPIDITINKDNLTFLNKTLNKKMILTR